MAPAVKLLAGLVATGLVTKVAYMWERQGLLADLGRHAAQTMAAHGINDGAARWTDADGWTYRTARLSGSGDTATRAAVAAELAAVPGIGGVVWEPR
jgi:hypothetical protein